MLEIWVCESVCRDFCVCELWNPKKNEEDLEKKVVCLGCRSLWVDFGHFLGLSRKKTKRPWLEFSKVLACSSFFVAYYKHAMPSTRVPFRKQLLDGERVLYQSIDRPPVQKRSCCQWLSEAFKACFYRRKPCQDEPLLALPRVRKDCC